MNMHLNFSLTADEYVNLMRYLVNWRRYAWIIGVAMLFVLAQYFVIGLQALAYLGMLLVFLVLLYFLVQRSVRKGFLMSPQLQAALHYHFTEAGFQVRTEEVENEYTWDMFWRAREVPEWFLLQQNGGVYNYVPKRAFNSLAEEEEFRKFLKEKELLAG